MPQLGRVPHFEHAWTSRVVVCRLIWLRIINSVKTGKKKTNSLHPVLHFLQFDTSTKNKLVFGFSFVPLVHMSLLVHVAEFKCSVCDMTDLQLYLLQLSICHRPAQKHFTVTNVLYFSRDLFLPQHCIFVDAHRAGTLYSRDILIGQHDLY